MKDLPLRQRKAACSHILNNKKKKNKKQGGGIRADTRPKYATESA